MPSFRWNWTGAFAVSEHKKKGKKVDGAFTSGKTEMGSSYTVGIASGDPKHPPIRPTNVGTIVIENEEGTYEPGLAFIYTDEEGVEHTITVMLDEWCSRIVQAVLVTQLSETSLTTVCTIIGTLARTEHENNIEPAVHSLVSRAMEPKTLVELLGQMVAKARQTMKKAEEEK